MGGAPAMPAGGAPGPAAPAAPLLKFRLSNGVAAPENDGQATNFTVEYVLEAGNVAPDTKLVWVIHPAKGDDIVKPITIRAKRQAALILERRAVGPWPV